MIPLQFLGFAFGTALIRLLHTARRRLTGEERYFSFSDFLIEESRVHARGFVYMALPPFVGGVILALLPGVHPIVATGAGFLAAFIGVWPVFQFPYQLLDEYLLPYWGKLRFLYVLFVGFSTALCYLGFVSARETLPLVVQLTGTGAWRNFLDDVAANAIYDIVKAAVLGLLVLGGIYVSRERKRIGVNIEERKQKEWEERLSDYSRGGALETIQGAAGGQSDGEGLG